MYYTTVFCVVWCCGGVVFILLLPFSDREQVEHGSDWSDDLFP